MTTTTVFEPKKFKVIVVGNPEVGKTSLVSTLKLQRKNSFDANTFGSTKYRATIGMEYSKVEMSVFVDARKLAALPRSKGGLAPDLIFLGNENDAVIRRERDQTREAEGEEERYAEEKVFLEIYDTCGAELASVQRRNQKIYGGGFAPEVTSNYIRNADAALFCFEMDNIQTLNDLENWNKHVLHRPENDDDTAQSRTVKNTCIYVVVGTKLDKIMEGKKTEEGQTTTNSYDSIASFKTDLERIAGQILDPARKDISEVWTTSAKTGYYVSTLFEEVACRCYCVSKGWNPHDDWCVSETKMKRMNLVPDKIKEMVYTSEMGSSSSSRYKSTKADGKNTNRIILSDGKAIKIDKKETGEAEKEQRFLFCCN